ncbi:hypothetical protein LOAG_05617 [Loa loa]|uniref:Uncharacterized protein n=1 Tax=Loa loa TaxID=7209 RepID=A0A1S0TZI9_LOALO|nr:hypothetical protein LOAG_05617 [Loa loa]EFO22867.1 hypothetical protein LOAG_05617 [Loa loa]
MQQTIEERCRVITMQTFWIVYFDLFTSYYNQLRSCVGPCMCFRFRWFCSTNTVTLLTFFFYNRAELLKQHMLSPFLTTHIKTKLAMNTVNSALPHQYNLFPYNRFMDFRLKKIKNKLRIKKNERAPAFGRGYLFKERITA